MVGGDGVDGPVGQPVSYGLYVGVGAQWRVDLEYWVVGGACRVGEGEVVGGGLGGHRKPGGLGPPHHGYRRCGGQVLEVGVGPGEAHQGDVAHDHELLGLGRLAGNPETGRPLSLVHEASG